MGRHETNGFNLNFLLFDFGRPTCSRMGLAFNFCLMLSIEKARLKKKGKRDSRFSLKNQTKPVYGQTFLSLTLLQVYPSYSGNKHREHGASLLVSTRSESEPVGVFKVSLFRLYQKNKCFNEKISS